MTGMREIVCLAAVAIGSMSHAETVQKPGDPGEPEDDTIYVLVTMEAGLNTSQIASEITKLEAVFPQTVFSGGVGNAGATVTVINKWSPLIMSPGTAGCQYAETPCTFSGSDQSNWADAAIWVNLDEQGQPTGDTIRNAMGADVVIAFVDSLPPPDPDHVDCGYTVQGQWIGPNASFQGTGVPPLDLRFLNTEFGFLSIVSLGPGCTSSSGQETAAHEFGHIFGAGHYADSDPQKPERGLYSDSRGAYYDICWTHYIPYYPYYYVECRRQLTVMTYDDSSICSGHICGYANKFSDEVVNMPGHKNSRAVETTALTVANYRVGAPSIGGMEGCFDGIDNDGDGQVDSQDPDCASGSELPPPPAPPVVCDYTTPPYYLYTYLLGCDVKSSGTWTDYRIQWSHHCESEVLGYEVWKQLSSTSPWVYGWVEVVPHTGVEVLNTQTARIKVRSCGAGGCSTFSPPSSFLPDSC